MAKFDTADLLSRCQLHSGRPSTDQAMTDTRWYSFLTEAQDHWTRVIASHYPEAMYGAPVKMETDDSGATYRLPLSGSDEVFPLGIAEVRASRNGRLLRIGAEFEENVDFTAEGTKLRVPHGKTRTFSDGPYIRYVAEPGVIDASTEPTLKPVFARILLVYHACWLWASRPPHAADPEAFLALEQRAWNGAHPDVEGDFGISGALALQYLIQDGDMEMDQETWWHSRDLG